MGCNTRWSTMQCEAALNNNNNDNTACTSVVGGRRVEGDGRISKMMQASDLPSQGLGQLH
jgi:hypothetical protein